MTDEFISKEDAIKQCGFGMTSLHIADNLRKMRPADVVRVVRCQNCKHHSYDETFSCYWCEYPGRVRETTVDGFCEKGEE